MPRLYNLVVGKNDVPAKYSVYAHRPKCGAWLREAWNEARWSP